MPNPTLFLELTYPILVLVLFCLIARRGGRVTDLGLLNAWLVLFGLSGAFRILIELSPRTGPLLSLALFFLCLAGFLYRIGIPEISKRSRFRARSFAWLLPLGFLLVRSFFPQFDVDSLLYHLSGIKFLAMRHLLPEVQRNLEVASFWYNWLAFEESLLIPVANFDLGLAGGLLGGVFKFMSILTVVSLVPRPAFFLRAVVVLLFLVDDHFFFSGQSRFVYLNPCLIGLLPLGAWFAFRSFFSPERFLLPAALAGLMAMSVKLHGVYFLAIFLLVGAAGCLRKRAWPWSGLRTLGKGSWLALASGCAGFFLLRWFAHGSPLAPFDLLWWKADHQWRDPYILRNLEDGGRTAKLLSSPFRNLIFPGNHSLKAIAVLAVPAFVAVFVRWFRSRWLFLAAFCFALSMYWAQHSHLITTGESRYPRYVFGVAILGLVALALALHRTGKKLGRKFRIYPSHLLRVRASWAGSAALFLFLVGTIDTRYYNVPSGERPSWKHIGLFLSSLLQGENSLDPSSEHAGRLMLPEVREEMPPLIACAREKLGEAASTGAGLAVFGRGVVNWPMIMLAPGAVGGDQWEGGGYQRGIGRQQDLIDFGVRYVVLPKRPEFRAMFRDKTDQLVELELNGEVLCESANLKLIELRAL